MKVGERWERTVFEGKFYQFEGSLSPLREDHVKSAIPLYMLHNREILIHLQVTSIIFIILPDESAEVYGVPKLLAHFKFGIPSQCIISSKYSGQRNDKNKDLYCANVAIKVNAKLSSVVNAGQVWDTYYPNDNGIDQQGIPWVRDVPTFVMGISTSNTLGQNAVSIISASACLDQSCMRMAQDVKVQNKTELINGSILEDITRNLLVQYYYHNDCQIPERMVIFRG